MYRTLDCGCMLDDLNYSTYHQADGTHVPIGGGPARTFPRNTESLDLTARGVACGPIETVADVKPGLYLHHKGATYIVLFVALDSTDPQPEPRKKVVVYVSNTHGTVHTRDQEQFRERVKWFTGEEAPRFRPVVPA